MFPESLCRAGTKRKELLPVFHNLGVVNNASMCSSPHFASSKILFLISGECFQRLGDSSDLTKMLRRKPVLRLRRDAMPGVQRDGID